MSLSRITFIINPVAGGRDKTGFEKRLYKRFRSAGFNVEHVYTQYPSHAYEFAKREVSRGTEVVVAVGGDGTINEVARALINSDTALGVIPYGSGNGFARHFNIPVSVKKALTILESSNIRTVDVGYINSKPFFCTSGIGFDAETGYFFSNYQKRGFISYALSFVRVFRNYKSKHYEVEVNGRLKTYEAFFINIANISQFGFHFYVAPGASAEDGYFDFVVVKKFPKWKGFILAARSFAGTIHKSKYVEVEKAQNINLLKPSGSKIIHIDGDPAVVDGNIEYRLDPQALRVILPQ